MNMNAEFEDSIEDVYCGPITLKEKKRDVLRKIPVEYITDRSSLSVNPTFIDDKSSRLNELIICDLHPYQSRATSQENQNFIQKLAKELDLTDPTNECSLINDNEFKEEMSTIYHSVSSTNSSFLQDIVNISSEKENSIITDDSSVDEDSLDNKQEGTYEIPKFTSQNTMKDLIDCFNNLDVIEEVDENTQLDSKHSTTITSQKEIEELMEQSKAESSTTSNTSFKFNDTLEEMDRFLMYGQDYRMSTEILDISVSNKTDLKLEEKVEAAKIQSSKPTGIPISSRAATKTPIKKQINNQISLTKSTGKDRFKNIRSPVAMYIKNSGYAPLFKTLTPRKMNKENIPETSTACNVKCNVDTVAFPAVRYKPAKTKRIVEEGYKLPPSISTLIPLKAKVGIHQRRGRQLESIIDGDLTLADNTLNSSKDISVVRKTNNFM